MTGYFIGALACGLLLNTLFTVFFSVMWEKAFINERPKLGIKRNRVLYLSVVIASVVGVLIPLMMGTIPAALFIPPMVGLSVPLLVTFYLTERARKKGK